MKCEYHERIAVTFKSKTDVDCGRIFKKKKGEEGGGVGVGGGGGGSEEI